MAVYPEFEVKYIGKTEPEAQVPKKDKININITEFNGKCSVVVNIADEVQHTFTLRKKTCDVRFTRFMNSRRLFTRTSDGKLGFNVYRGDFTTYYIIHKVEENEHQELIEQFEEKTNKVLKYLGWTVSIYDIPFLNGHGLRFTRINCGNMNFYKREWIESVEQSKVSTNRSLVFCRFATERFDEETVSNNHGLLTIVDDKNDGSGKLKLPWFKNYSGILIRRRYADGVSYEDYVIEYNKFLEESDIIDIFNQHRGQLLQFLGYEGYTITMI